MSPVIAATDDGGVLVADAASSDLDGYGPDGRLRFHCVRAIGIDYLHSLAVDGDEVLLGANTASIGRG